MDEIIVSHFTIFGAQSFKKKKTKCRLNNKQNELRLFCVQSSTHVTVLLTHIAIDEHVRVTCMGCDGMIVDVFCVSILY